MKLFLALSLALVLSVKVFAQVKQIEKPAFFKTLVNPECSHCIDESKRRAGELRDDDRVLAWIRGKYDRASGVGLDPQSVQWLLIWLVVCFTGLVGPVANAAHVAGLLTGMVCGRITAFFATRS